MWISAGAIVAFTAAVFFSTKAIFVKLTYLYGADAITALALRMIMALPMLLVIAWYSTARRRAAADPRRLESGVPAGLRRLLPLQPARFPRAANTSPPRWSG